jgi:hypothetical protein
MKIKMQHQNLWDVLIAVYKGGFITIKTYIRKEKVIMLVI